MINKSLRARSEALIIRVTGDLIVLRCDSVTFRMILVGSSSKLDSPIDPKAKGITTFRKDRNKLKNDMTSYTRGLLLQHFSGFKLSI
jgi:hypothetical protein